ncbi:RNA polymerase sigma factor [compost metagenome]
MEVLTEREKELIRLKFFDDLDYDEIAVKCGITKRTAYNITHDALKKLRESLKGKNGEDYYSLFSIVILLSLYLK